MACFGSDLEALHKARHELDGVFAHVHPDHLYARPLPARHRIVFYVGHVEAFDWNLYTRYIRQEASATANLDQLFAFGIDPEPGALPSDQPRDWPEISVVREYRDQLRECVDRHWNELSDTMRHVAIEHRLMHAESLAYMLHNMPHEQLAPNEPAESIE